MEGFGFKNVLRMFYQSNYENKSQQWRANQLGMPSSEVFSIIHIEYFLELIEDEIIQEFLAFDRCYKLADKYLLSMVFVYFVRAKLPLNEYTRTNFFVALFLAHDLEEDDEDLKLCFVDWGLGAARRKSFDYFISLRDKMWKDMNYRACVSLKCCHQIMEAIPDCSLWKRERDTAHGGAFRDYGTQRNEKCCRCNLLDGNKRFYWSDFESSSENDSDESWSDGESSSPPAKRIRSSEE